MEQAVNNHYKIRKFIQEALSIIDEEELDEERIANKDAAAEVEAKRNFVGSHTYGEDIGDLGKMYVAYSYGEHHPLYVYYDGSWYYNTSNYILKDGTVNPWTQKHLDLLRPNVKTQGRSGRFLTNIIDDFKNRHGIGNNSHTDLKPGQK